MTRSMTLLFAVAGGAAVGNLYWAQPLLDFIARDLHASQAAAGALVTVTQIGYALGVLLLVPLGDVVDRRRLVPLMLTLSALALAASALAPSFAALLGTLAAVGVTTVAGQILTPLAGDLASDEDRGRVVGTVVSGLLTGILVSRTVSGLIAGLLGWRAVFGVGAVLDLVLAAVLLVRLPTLAPKTTSSYRALIASVGGLLRHETAVRWTVGFGAAAFGLFSMFWTALTLLLSAPPFDYSVTVIGLFGLAGLAGALAAQRAGVLYDRGLSVPAIGVAWVVVAVAFVVAGLGAHSVVAILVAIVLLDIGVQGSNILNQNRLFSLSVDLRSRLNTVFVVCNFLGGAVGSAAAAVLWNIDGWTAISVAGLVVSFCALSGWSVGRRGPLRPAPHAQR